MTRVRHAASESAYQAHWTQRDMGSGTVSRLPYLWIPNADGTSAFFHRHNPLLQKRDKRGDGEP